MCTFLLSLSFWFHIVEYLLKARTVEPYFNHFHLWKQDVTLILSECVITFKLCFHYSLPQHIVMFIIFWNSYCPTVSSHFSSWCHFVFVHIYSGALSVLSPLLASFSVSNLWFTVHFTSHQVLHTHWFYTASKLRIRLRLSHRQYHAVTVFLTQMGWPSAFLERMKWGMGRHRVLRKRGICWLSYSAPSLLLIQSFGSMFYGLK
jgi:hypothetical protein